MNSKSCGMGNMHCYVRAREYLIARYTGSVRLRLVPDPPSWSIAADTPAHT